MDLDEFTRSNAPKDGTEAWELENGKLLDVTLDGSVMAKAGTMIAYTGDISFEAKGGGGISGMLKKAVTSEGTATMQATGQGHLYLADQGKKVQIIQLDPDEEISVNGNDVLAFEDTVDWDIRTVGSIGGASAGGLFNMFLTGPGHVAITTHGDPLVLETPVSTDPNATVAWSSDVSPSRKTDRNIKGFLGRESGETYQMEFTEPGGFVIVQPFEERTPQQ